MKDPLEKALELLESSARFLLMVGNEAWAGVNLEVALVGRRRAVLGVSSTERAKPSWLSWTQRRRNEAGPRGGSLS